MKNGFIAAALVLVLSSCGNSTDAEGTTSDTMHEMSPQVGMPPGDTANQINSSSGAYPADTSTQNADDSIKGSNPASRTTTKGTDTSGANASK